jgi:hypothetical protein
VAKSQPGNMNTLIFLINIEHSLDIFVLWATEQATTVCNGFKIFRAGNAKNLINQKIVKNNINFIFSIFSM